MKHEQLYTKVKYPLHKVRNITYNASVASVTMTINAIQNKRIGPGGRARQLHHQVSEIGSLKPEISGFRFPASAT